MNLELTKEKVKTLLNKKIKIKVNIGRNKHEYYEGYIEKLHPNIFTIKTNQGIKSFTYTDVLTKNVILTKF
ncbi:MAG: Veg family protein [Bacilli bacterium]|nr:Veg family protein [Bacilli bacterium]